MFILRDKLPPTMHDQIAQLDQPVTNCAIVIARCDCNEVVNLTARALIRRWGDKPRYLCKSCSVKTYARDPEKLRKYRKTFAKTTNNAEYKRQRSLDGQKPWRDPIIRARITEAVRQDNIVNPKKAAARQIALKALQAKSWFKEHMVRIRAQQREDGASVIELAAANIFKGLRLDFKPQFVLGPYVYDFAIGKRLIEIQGEYWHQNTNAKDSAKATYAVAAGYEIHHIWEHEFAALGKVRENVQRWFGLISDDLIDFDFKQTKIEEAPTLSVRVFLGAYHYLPAISKSGWHIGSYLDDELIATATFSSVVRRETAIKIGGTVTSVRELSRFCIHPSRHKPNFATWFLNKAVRAFKTKHPTVKTLVAFADETAGHTGGVYRAAGWIYTSVVEPDYIYLTGDGHYAHKKTIWDRASKLKMTELEYATIHGLVRVNSKRKHKFTLSLE